MTGGPRGTLPPPDNPPRRLTSRALIADVANRWRAQYYHDARGWTQLMGGSAERIYEKLLALDLQTASRAEVEAAIGNSSWTTIRCDGCHKDVELAVEVGEPRDYESSMAVLCTSCLALALAAAQDGPA